MERINDREAVAKLARAVLGKGERTTNEEAVLELLFVMSREDEAAGRAKRAARPGKKIARSA
ncbi:MAG: hypothetical protein HUU15_00825 [Candidatus Brocadiae bacterium]|nr:hypothetical protein [Candidatus Brocadiia bacterium]